MYIKILSSPLFLSSIYSPTDSPKSTTFIPISAESLRPLDHPSSFLYGQTPILSTTRRHGRIRCWTGVDPIWIQHWGPEDDALVMTVSTTDMDVGILLRWPRRSGHCIWSHWKRVGSVLVPKLFWVMSGREVWYFFEEKIVVCDGNCLSLRCENRAVYATDRLWNFETNWISSGTWSRFIPLHLHFLKQKPAGFCFSFSSPLNKKCWLKRASRVSFWHRARCIFAAWKPQGFKDLKEFKRSNLFD